MALGRQSCNDPDLLQLPSLAAQSLSAAFLGENNVGAAGSRVLRRGENNGCDVFAVKMARIIISTKR